MTLWVKRVLAVLLLIPAAYYSFIVYQQFEARTQHAAQSSVFWTEDVAAGFKQAAEQDKKILIDFYATWCLPCMEMEKKTFSHPDLQQEILQNFVPIRINCTRETDICRSMVSKYDIIGWPTLVVTDAQGKVIDKTVGKNFSPGELRDYLKEILNR